MSLIENGVNPEALAVSDLDLEGKLQVGVTKLIWGVMQTVIQEIRKNGGRVPKERERDIGDSN